jgi:hypothetical protein
MMTNHPADDGESFVIPARRLSGSKREIIEEIDQAIVGLLALRHLVGGGAPPPEAIELGGGQPSRLHKTRLPSLFAALRRA